MFADSESLTFVFLILMMDASLKINSHEFTNKM